MITKITKEQEALIPKFCQEYLNIGLSTEPISLEGMKPVIEAWYAYLKQPKPSYFIFSSPAICSMFCSLFLNNKNSQLDSQLYSQLLDTNYWHSNLAGAWISYFKCSEKWGVQFTPEVQLYLNQWETIAQHGFHWWPRVGIAVCSDRPRRIEFNSEKSLHSDGRKAVEFSDGWGIYCHDGVRLPENYGSTKTKDWKSEWILKEENAELKMTLIKGIGYEKMCQDLEAKKIDSWREYELLRIENVDVEPIQLNKMTCPSTGKIHVHRVPPDIKTAREAIQWSNFGIDPESFSVEC